MWEKGMWEGGLSAKWGISSCVYNPSHHPRLNVTTHRTLPSATHPTHSPTTTPTTTPHPRCFYGAVGGMLLRLADIKRKQAGFLAGALRGFFTVTLLFAAVLPDNLLDPIIIWWVDYFSCHITPHPALPSHLTHTNIHTSRTLHPHISTHTPTYPPTHTSPTHLMDSRNAAQVPTSVTPARYTRSPARSYSATISWRDWTPSRSRNHTDSTAMTAQRTLLPRPTSTSLEVRAAWARAFT